ncbi:MAG: hypothetical protein KJ792_14845 [Actinobacteria bacterium]|nr:hypothetical protein [Actinomycetota bacterium]MCG2801812.1 hypothetical protein [Cellulomonas sp.]
MPLTLSGRGLLAASGLAVAGLTAALLAGAGPAVAAGTGVTTGTGSTATDGPVVLLGTTGVRWSDVSGATPALAGLASQFALGDAAVRSVRQVACPADGWLAVSAGTRAADVQQPDGGCRPLTGPTADGAVPGWADYLTAAADDGYDARPGLLGDRVAGAGLAVRSIGAGAAIATATSGGVPVGTWSDLPAQAADLRIQVAEALTGGDRLVVVDLGSVRTDGSTLAQVDERLAAALAGVHDAGVGAGTVVVASLADRDDTPALQLAAVRGPGVEATLATSSSTRQIGLVVGTDVVATVVHALGLPDDGLVGAPVTSTRRAPADRVAALVDTALHASVARPLVPAFYLGLVLLNIALYAAVAFGLARAPGRRAVGERHRAATARGVQLVALSVGAVPVGLLTANLVPWWRADVPALALAAASLVVVAALVTVALLGPWRRAVLGPAGAVAAVTCAVLVVDVATGGRLQISAVIGAPTLAAGRFYGFNNTAFALATAATLFAVTAVVDPWVRVGRRGLAAGVVAVTGLGLTVLDGAPELGADFGGPPAVVPAFTVLALLAWGARITWRRAAWVLAGAAAVTAAFAGIDWLRPADQRTHLGQLVQTAIDGGLWDVIARKASANLAIIGNNRPLTLLTLAGVVFVVAALVRPVRRLVLSPDGGRYGWLSHGTALGAITVAAPMLAPCLMATATALLIGFAMNDSGIAIPALGVSITVPLLIATCATWLRGLPAPDGPVRAGGVTAAGEAGA